MAVSDLDYRFKPRMLDNGLMQQDVPERYAVKSTPQPNRKSEAKKRWWAEKKAREAGEV